MIVAGRGVLYNGDTSRPVDATAVRGDETLQHVKAGRKRQEAQALRQKALEPQVKRCYLLHVDVSVLVEYPDYKGPHHKGREGAIYCENIVPCYQANRECRYSGISPLYPDPFLPRERPEPPEEEDLDPEGEPEDEPPSF